MQFDIDSDAEYVLRNITTQNMVYICRIRRFGHNRSEFKSTLYISMCGYGPVGRASYKLQFKTLEQLKEELSLFWEHPNRKKDLDNLVIERWNKKTGKMTKPPMKTFLRNIERDIIIQKLSGK